ncbi:MAG: HEPN domain-containing protein [Chloroflexi bacterium]|nr:HEPN domain-containing protein [Chloroflexota bacterium]
MRPDPKAEGKRWLQQAEHDLDDASYALAGERYNLACFLAQQAAEKALKAYLFSRNAQEVWGHSVAELCDDARALDPEFGPLRKRAALLDKFYIPTRYPNGLPGGIPSEAFDLSEARRALELAQEVLRFVQGRG